MRSFRFSVFRTNICAVVLGLLLLLSPTLLQHRSAYAEGSDVAKLCETLKLKDCGLQQSCGTSCCGCTSCGDGGNRGNICPPGYSVYDDYCLPDCPAGFTRYPGLPGLCLPPCHHGCPTGYEPIPVPSCPDGFHRDLRQPDLCVPDVGADTQCPEGLRYSLNTGRCDPICPRGTYLAEDNLCHSYYEKECPQGYQRNAETGACIPQGSWPVDYQFICMPACPQGWVRDIYEPTRCKPPETECPQGTENVRGLCLPVCADGATRNDYGYCEPQQCPPDTYQDLRGNCVPVQCPQGFDAVDGQCLPPCQDGYARTHNTKRCEPVEPGCPDGFVMEQGQCVPQQPDCPQGTSFNASTGECDPPPPIECKKGLVFNKRTKKCEPPPRTTTECPKNFVRKNGECVKITIDPKCPPGFTRTKEGRCLQDTPVIPKEPDCKQGMHYDDSIGDCVPDIHRLPNACPEGMHFSKRRQRCELNAPDLPNLDVPQPQLDPGKLINPEPQPCGDGELRDKNGRCVPAARQQPNNKLLVPKLKLEPGVLKKMLECPEGQVRDPNGRCQFMPN